MATVDRQTNKMAIMKRTEFSIAQIYLAESDMWVKFNEKCIGCLRRITDG